MLDLLGLPFEIRERIIQYALHNDMLEQPRAVDVTALRRECRTFPHHKNDGWSTSNEILFPADRPFTSALHRVNRQLRAEAIAALDRLRGTDCMLDLALVSETILVPRWLLLSKEPRRVRRLTCAIRPSGFVDKDFEFEREYSGFRMHYGKGPAIAVSR